MTVWHSCLPWPLIRLSSAACGAFRFLQDFRAATRALPLGLRRALQATMGFARPSRPACGGTFLGLRPTPRRFRPYPMRTLRGRAPTRDLLLLSRFLPVVPGQARRILCRIARHGSARAGCGKSEETDEQPTENTAQNYASRASWARLMTRILEIDPLLCIRCEAQMKIIVFLAEPDVVHKIVHHVEASGRDNPFEARAPPT